MIRTGWLAIFIQEFVKFSLVVMVDKTQPFPHEPNINMFIRFTSTCSITLKQHISNK